jgi:hypothetical protein
LKITTHRSASGTSSDPDPKIIGVMAPLLQKEIHSPLSEEKITLKAFSLCNGCPKPMFGPF